MSVTLIPASATAEVARATAVRRQGAGNLSTGGIVARVSVLVLLAVLVINYVFSGGTQAQYAAQAASYGMVALSLNVLIGYIGQLSLGHQGLVGVGACLAAYVSSVQGFPFFVSLAVGTVVGGLVAFLVGLVALRITGLYLALVTLVFGLTLESSVFEVPFLSNGGAGQPALRPSYLPASDNRAFVLVCIAGLGLVFYLDRRLTSSKGGRALLALKENERVAEAFGVNVTAYKLLAFVFSGATAGLAGSLLVFNTQQFVGINYSFTLALTFVIMTVVGGTGSRVGVILGGTLYVALNPLFEHYVVPLIDGLGGPFTQSSKALPSLFGALLLLLTLAKFPGGIAQQLKPVLDWLSFKPFDIHASKNASGPGAVEGSSVRA